MAILHGDHLIGRRNLSLLCLKVLIYAPYVIISSFLQQSFVTDISKYAKQISLIDAAVTIHVIDSKSELFRKFYHINIEFMLANYLLLQLFIENFVVNRHAEIEERD